MTMTAFDPDWYRERGYTEDSILGIMYAREMSDGDLLAAARDSDSEQHQAFMAFLGADTNPTWITARCAETAYERGLIDEQELDWITR